MGLISGKKRMHKRYNIILTKDMLNFIMRK